MKHLTDGIIQEYFDSGEKLRKITIENHCLVCFECQEKLEQYRELYRNLAVDTEPTPDAAFNLEVLAAISRLESRKISRQFVAIASSLAGAAVLVFSLIFFDVVTWASALSGTRLILTKATEPFVVTASSLIRQLNGNLELLAFAGLALLLFQLLDYSLVRNKVNQSR